jgi:hypothetical protein
LRPSDRGSSASANTTVVARLKAQGTPIVSEMLVKTLEPAAWAVTMGRGRTTNWGWWSLTGRRRSIVRALRWSVYALGSICKIHMWVRVAPDRRRRNGAIRCILRAMRARGQTTKTVGGVGRRVPLVLGSSGRSGADRRLGCTSTKTTILELAISETPSASKVGKG